MVRYLPPDWESLNASPSKQIRPVPAWAFLSHTEPAISRTLPVMRMSFLTSSARSMVTSRLVLVRAPSSSHPVSPATTVV